LNVTTARLSPLISCALLFAACEVASGAVDDAGTGGGGADVMTPQGGGTGGSVDDAGSGGGGASGVDAGPGAGGGATAVGGGSGGGATVVDAGRPVFSFFVTSLAALQALSGSQAGFGGDLRYAETGPGAGLRGADKLCAAIAERSEPGAGSRTWRAFLSADEGEDGGVVNAVDRIGQGPWYDRLGRVVAVRKGDLLATRPLTAAAAIKNDLPNEDGVPNHRPDPTQPSVDNHDTLTGSTTSGLRWTDPQIVSSNCRSWTSASPNPAVAGRPRVGHSWPRGSVGAAADWINSIDESGCAPGVNLIETGPPDPDAGTVGSGGGYGGFYCFAVNP
jgi:hypothetical protein